LISCVEERPCLSKSYTIFFEQSSSEPKVKAYIPMYEPLEVTKCKKCGKIIAEPKELIRIINN